jgi:DNA polymerase-3 subunit gamma/tau
VITVANQLLDAGNSPAQLARQFVRYLRNSVIAKIAGIGVDGAGADGIAGELLQISADEQRRAGRSAALFSEEELTRFLQVMLRTFDELGYRQEQRFHFELGLLKLVHLRRLLPIEEVLSQFPVGGGGSGQARVSGAAKAVSVPAGTSAKSGGGIVAARVLEASVVVDTKPAFSPFEQDKGRKRFEAVEVVPVVAMPSIAAPAPVIKPMEAVKVVSEPIALPASPVLEEAEVVDLLPSPLHDVEALQKAAVKALISAKSQETAADAMADAEWVVAEGEIRVQTDISKTMLPMVINAEAEKLIRGALRDSGAAALKLVLLPGAKNAAAAKRPKAVKSGSAQALAMEHPIVQRAQTLFNAEIQSVIDLRDND